MSLFSKLILLTNLEYLIDILICFFLGKFIPEIHEFNSSLRMHILLATHAILQIHRNIDGNKKIFLLFQGRGNDALMEQSLLQNFRACTYIGDSPKRQKNNVSLSMWKSLLKSGKMRISSFSL